MRFSQLRRRRMLRRYRSSQCLCLPPSAAHLSSLLLMCSNRRCHKPADSDRIAVFVELSNSRETEQRKVSLSRRFMSTVTSPIPKRGCTESEMVITLILDATRGEKRCLPRPGTSIAENATCCFSPYWPLKVPIMVPFTMPSLTYSPAVMNW